MKSRADHGRCHFADNVQDCPASRSAARLVGVVVFLLAQVHPQKLLRGVAEALEPALKSRAARQVLDRTPDQVRRVDVTNRAAAERSDFARQVAGQVPRPFAPRGVCFVFALFDACGLLPSSGDTAALAFAALIARLLAGRVVCRYVAHHLVGHGVCQRCVVERIADLVLEPLPQRTGLWR